MALGFAEIPFLSLVAVIAAHVIARPHEDLMALLPK